MTTTTNSRAPRAERRTFASEDGNDDVGVGNGYALACSTSGFGDGANRTDDGVENGADAAPRPPRLKISSGEDQRAPRTKRLAPWYEGFRAKITAMAIRWTAIDCCVARQQGVYVVPIWELTRDVESAGDVVLRPGHETGERGVVVQTIRTGARGSVVAICVGVTVRCAWDVAKGSPVARRAAA